MLFESGISYKLYCCSAMRVGGRYTAAGALFFVPCVEFLVLLAIADAVLLVTSIDDDM